jgi:mannose-1-phosphate guanylyltransferase
MNLALDFADSNDALVTLGIEPHRPDTGYGYIQYTAKEISNGINKVVTFTEKPPLETAEKFIKSGDFLWNSGMFVWRADNILDSFRKFLPEMAMAFSEVKGAYNTGKEYDEISRIYAQINSVSIDNGILEHANNVYVVPSEFGWSDLGTWKSVQEHTTLENNNYSINVDLHAIESKDNLIVSEDKKLVVLQGLEGYFIIDSKNALLVCKNNYEQEIKKINSDVKKEYKDKYN